MFYTVLLFLTLYSFGKNMKNFVRENVTVKDGQKADIPGMAYISLGIMAIFHTMVLAICLLPSILFR